MTNNVGPALNRTPPQPSTTLLSNAWRLSGRRLGRRSHPRLRGNSRLRSPRSRLRTLRCGRLRCGKCVRRSERCISLRIQSASITMLKRWQRKISERVTCSRCRHRCRHCWGAGAGLLLAKMTEAPGNKCIRLRIVRPVQPFSVGLGRTTRGSSSFSFGCSVVLSVSFS